MNICCIIILFVSLVASTFIAFSSTDNIFGTESIPKVTTRNHFDHFANPTVNKPTYEPFPFPFQAQGCPQETVIYIHGVWTAKDKIDEISRNMFENAPEVFNRAKLSLENHDYMYPLIGYSWDSDTSISEEGWNYAKIIAKKNGPKLAKFILDFKNNCSQTKIRLVAHSLGARVVLSALDSLNKNEFWNAGNFKITSVHLLGAAVDYNEVSKNIHDVLRHDYVKDAYGNAIEDEVVYFYNLFDSEDDALEPGYVYLDFFFQLHFGNFNFSEKQFVYYPFFEQAFALGQKGIDPTVFSTDVPQNYMDIPVKHEIKYIEDADGDQGCDLKSLDGLSCTIKQVGDNHLGYVGFRGPNHSLIDNGAMNIVVDTFQTSP